MIAAPPAYDAREQSEIKRSFAQAATDYGYFVTHYGKISDATRQEVIPYEEWPHLALLHELYKTRRKILILKSRQVGVSWDTAGYCLWTAKFHQSSNALIFSKGQEDSSVVLDRVRFIDAQLPDWMVSTYGRSNEGLLEFPRRHSKVRAFPATENAGRSETASLVFLDEFAFYGYADELYTAVKPTTDAGGQVVICSTANGTGNKFHGLWVAAAEPGFDVTPDGVWVGKEPAGNGYTAVFIPWRARPTRTDAWYAEQRADFSPDRLNQEYPETPDEAFRQSGRPVFLAEALVPTGLKPLPMPETPTTEIARLEGLVAHRTLSVYRWPEAGRRYTLGADIAEGLANRDASALVVLDVDDLTEVAHYHSRLPPDEVADHIDWIASAWPGLVAVERNNHGTAVLVRLRQIRGAGPTKYVLYEEVDPLRQPTGTVGGKFKARQLGWSTNRRSKPLMISELEEAIRKGWLQLSTGALLTELRLYQRFDDGSTGAPSGPDSHDDRVIALAICFAVRKWLTSEMRRRKPRTRRVRGIHAA